MKYISLFPSSPLSDEEQQERTTFQNSIIHQIKAGIEPVSSDQKMSYDKDYNSNISNKNDDSNAERDDFFMDT